MTEPRETGRAELSALRLFAIVAALFATLVAAIAPLLALQRGLDVLHPSELCLLGALALIVVTGASAPWLGARMLRRMSACAAAAWLLLQIGFLWVSAEQSALTPWMLTASGAAVVSALVAGGLAAAWGLQAATTILVIAHRALLGDLTFPGWVNDTQTLVAGIVAAAIGAMTLDASRRLDAAGADRAAAAAVASAARGRLAARTRAAAVVHDDVLATLSLAGSALPVPRDLLAAQAQRALRSVRELASATPSPAGPISREILDALTSRDPGAHVAVTGEDVCQVPGDVRDALVGAVTQAIDNSIRHAGPGARRSLVVERRADGVSIVLSDDGVGFDPAAVPATRLGVRVSIEQRAREAGGSAVVLSRPGHGTRVLIEWSPPDAGGRIEVRDDPRILRVSVAVIAAVFVVTQSSLALLALPSARIWWVPPAVCLAVFVATEVLRFSPSPVPSTRRLVAVTAITVAAVAGGVAASSFSFADMWFVTTAAFVFVAIALRGCIRSALLGGALLLAVTAAGGLLAGAPPGMFFMVGARAVVVISIAAGLTAVVGRLQRRTTRLHERTVRDVERAAWDVAGRDELIARAVEVVDQAGPVLERIATGDEIDDDLRRAALAVEGRLRDDLRAGRLARPALAQAAARARARGVDVLLLDDSAGRDDLDLDGIAVWMAAAVDGARERVVGRLLPPGRRTVASVTADGTSTDFGG